MQRHGVLAVLFMLLFSLLGLTGCNDTSQLAPVVELNWKARSAKEISKKTHTVHRGETLYSIAFRYDKDYRLLADFNRLSAPYSLREGQVIYLQYLQKVPNQYYAPVRNLKFSSNTQSDLRPRKARLISRPTFTKPVYKSTRRSTTAVTRPASQIELKPSIPFLRSGNSWQMPARGSIVRSFLPLQGKKGIDIAGLKGEPIHAARSGTVAYAGNGISGYGNLIIIKHEGQFLTAYGNNLKNYVHEGQKVKVGQIIAEMGRLDGKYWGVHFEIRKAGQPVNPVKYLN